MGAPTECTAEPSTEMQNRRGNCFVEDMPTDIYSLNKLVLCRPTQNRGMMNE